MEKRLFNCTLSVSAVSFAAHADEPNVADDRVEKKKHYTHSKYSKNIK